MIDLRTINNMLDRKKDVFLIGGGTSLKDFDFNRIPKDAYQMAINHTIEAHDKVDALMFSDRIFLQKTSFDITKFKGTIFTSKKTINTPPMPGLIEQDNVAIYNDERHKATSDIRDGLYHPTSTGIQAVNLALIMGARQIHLLGFDYFITSLGVHFYPDKDHHKQLTKEKYSRKAIKFREYRKVSDRIINYSIYSLVTRFIKRDWRTAEWYIL